MPFAMTSTADDSPAPDDVHEHEHEHDEGDDAPQKAPEPAAEPRSGKPVAVPWADRWWVWALGGLAFAAMIGFLHLTACRG
jgi:hypothetical protein